MGRRTVPRIATTLVAAVAGATLLSGTGQPVTAHPYPRWQRVAPPPIAPRRDALALAVGHRVLVLGGTRPGAPRPLDGASYDLRTGLWRRVALPVALTDRDEAAVAAGVVVVRRSGAGASAWWRYDVRRGAWSRLRGVPSGAHAPTAFGSEVYAVAGRRVVVYSVQLRRWTRLPVDRLRPALLGRHVTASRRGTVVTGHLAGAPTRLLADRWDGLAWHRVPATPSPPRARRTADVMRVEAEGRVLVVRGHRAWIRLP